MNLLILKFLISTQLLFAENSGISKDPAYNQCLYNVKVTSSLYQTKDDSIHASTILTAWGSERIRLQKKINTVGELSDYLAQQHPAAQEEPGVIKEAIKILSDSPAKGPYQEAMIENLKVKLAEAEKGSVSDLRKSIAILRNSKAQGTNKQRLLTELETRLAGLEKDLKANELARGAIENGLKEGTFSLSDSIDKALAQSASRVAFRTSTKLPSLLEAKSTIKSEVQQLTAQAGNLKNDALKVKPEWRPPIQEQIDAIENRIVSLKKIESYFATHSIDVNRPISDSLLEVAKKAGQSDASIESVMARNWLRESVAAHSFLSSAVKVAKKEVTIPVSSVGDATAEIVAKSAIKKVVKKGTAEITEEVAMTGGETLAAVAVGTGAAATGGGILVAIGIGVGIWGITEYYLPDTDVMAAGKDFNEELYMNDPARMWQAVKANTVSPTQLCDWAQSNPAFLSGLNRQIALVVLLASARNPSIGPMPEISFSVKTTPSNTNSRKAGH